MKARPAKVPSETWKILTENGTAFITVGKLDGAMFEVFVTVGKAGTGVRADAEAIGRLVSLALRSDISAADVVRQLTGIKGGQPYWYKGRQILSLADAVAYVLSQYEEDA